jgi:hypothetical protein
MHNCKLKLIPPPDSVYGIMPHRAFAFGLNVFIPVKINQIIDNWDTVSDIPD